MQIFQPFQERFIDGLLKINRPYLVTQDYDLDTDLYDQCEKLSLLLSAYDDLGLARTHLHAVREQKYAAIIDLDNKRHRAKILEMLRGDSRFRLFLAVVEDTKKLEAYLDKNFSHSMRKWVDKNTNWRIRKDAVIRPTLELIFGVLHINLKYSNQNVRLRFSDLIKI